LVGFLPQDEPVGFLRRFIMKENPNLFEENKQEYIDVLIEQINRMEFARVVHNHYVVTGKVQIPD
jgi:hypothetical protein